MLRRLMWLVVGLLLLVGCASTQPDQPALTNPPQPTADTAGAVMQITHPDGKTENIGRAEFEQLRDKLAQGQLSEEDVLNELAIRHLLLRQGQAADMTPDATELEEFVQNLKTNACTQLPLPPEQLADETKILDVCAQFFGFANEAALRTYISEDQIINSVLQKQAAGEEVQASHILLMVEPQLGPDATQEDKDKRAAEVERRKGEIEQIFQQVMQNPDSFADVANEKTEDPSGKGKGGDLGFFGRGRMVEPFDKAVFALKDGEISQPVLTDFGWHIIKRTGSRIAPEPSQEEAQAYRQNILEQAKAEGRVKFLIDPKPLPTPEPQLELPPAQTEPNATTTP